MNNPPVLSTIPRSGTWFLRYAISFLCHLEHGGRIHDRLTGRIVGSPSGPRFDFQHFKGGPLFRVRGSLPADHLFIGHTVCPGFTPHSTGLDWWKRTAFHVPGYDYFHEGMDYRRTPVELGPPANAPVNVASMERAARKGRGQPIVLVYRNPIDQAVSYFRYCQNHKNPAYSHSRGRPLTGLPFHDYLFESALPSYAKQFVSFQVMAARHPHLVKLVSYERLMVQPVEVMAAMLDHLAGARHRRPSLPDAVWLARREHMKAIEKELGRSLDGTRHGAHSHIWHDNPRRPRDDEDGVVRRAAVAVLRALGLDVDRFEWPAALSAASAA